MIIYQNFTRAVKAWDHIQPWWRYFQYLSADFFPWSLLLPVAVINLVSIRKMLTPSEKFILLAFIVPFVLLSLSKSKQGKYLLMGYPFLALLLASSLSRISGVWAVNLRRLMGSVFFVPGSIIVVLLIFVLCGKAINPVIKPYMPYLNPIFIAGIVLFLGGLSLLITKRLSDGPRILTFSALTVFTVYLAAIPYGFAILNPKKDYKAWSERLESFWRPDHSFFWGEIRSGAIVYSDHLLPVITSPNQLSALATEDPGSIVITTRRQWVTGCYSLDETTMNKFKPLYCQSDDEGSMIILKPIHAR